jgi:hypothetical protein
MSKRIGLLSCVLAIALCPSWVAAQVNYKSTMPDGKVIYGDKPVAGAAKVDQIKPATTQGITPSSTKEAGVLSDLERSRENREAKGNRLRAAEQAVTRAEAALAAGKEPLPGEHIGTAGGGQRLTEAYFERQKQLEADLARARTDLANARADR